MSDWRVECGDSLALLRGLEDESIDAVVTDPPAGIAFMGKSWDSDKGGRDEWIAWLESIFVECLRVLNPGGHVLVWALPRTSHWTGTAIERAGFEMRDVLQHHFGSGFPKSLDVGKAIDKRRHDREQILEVTRWIAGARDAAGLTNAAIDEAFGFNGMAGHWTTQESQPQVPTLDQIPPLLELLDAVPTEEVQRLMFELNGRKGEPGEAWHRREVIGTKTAVDGRVSRPGLPLQPQSSREIEITTPATDASRKWNGWGTAIKPASEFWWMARKRLLGTVAETVLKHGTGALNVAANRVGAEGGGTHCDHRDEDGQCLGHENAGQSTSGETFHGPNTEGGRWPPHLLLSHWSTCGDDCAPGCPIAGLGDESEFFPNLHPDDPTGGDPLWRYVAKPSRAERDAGLIFEKLFCTCEAWVDEDREVDIPAASDTRPPMATTGSTTPSSGGTGSPTSSPGKLSEDRSQPATKSTTRTKTSRTTGSRTSNSSTPSPTSGSTPAVISGTGSGGSPADSAEKRNPSTPSTGTSPEKGGRSTGVADPAISGESSKKSKGDGRPRCDRCGRMDPVSGADATGRKEGSAGLSNPRAGSGRTRNRVLNIHSTVKPIELMRWLVRLVTPPGGVVLDPFCGSGSTGCAAVLEGFNFFGFDLEPDHVEIARDRIGWWAGVDRFKVTGPNGYETRTPTSVERDDMEAQEDFFSCSS